MFVSFEPDLIVKAVYCLFSKLDFNIFTDGYTYQRNVNHVAAPLEERLTGMYHAGAVFLTNSCMEAVTTLFDYLLPCNGKVVVNEDTYYETRQWLYLTKRYEVVEVDFSDLSLLKKAVKGVNIVYLDNPSFFMHWYDLKEIVSLAHKAGAKVIVDNTVLSLYYTNPLQDGADYAVESYSKYVSGHGDVMAGGIVCKEVPPNDMPVFIGRRGRCVSAMSVFLLERSLETFSVRMERHTKAGRYLDKKLKKYGVEHWYSGYGGCIIFPGLGEGFCNKLEARGHFKKCPTFGTTFSTTSFVRSPDLYRVENYARISCGLEDKSVLWDDVRRVLHL